MKRRRERLVLVVALVAFVGIAALFGSVAWYLWRDSVAAEERLVGGLAASLGERTEAMILDTRTLLEELDDLPHARCSPAHLQRLREAAVGRPHIRAIGYWRVTERRCGVGFLGETGLRPPRADRIYDSGVIAWWPSRFTEVGGVQLFLMRFGDHDAAIDPRVLLDVGPLEHRQAGLWVEQLRLTASPADAELPSPDSIPVGLTLDRERGRAISRYSREGVLPIEIVAIEPLDAFWGRYTLSFFIGSTVALILVGGWLYALWRYTRHRLSMGSQLRQALAHGQIHARYQPVIDLKSGRCIGAEALARWTMRGGERVTPDVFMPIAEREGLNAEITLAVLGAVFRDLRGVLTGPHRLGINVNLTPEDLKTDRFALALQAALTAGGIGASSIKLEITERALINTDSSRAMIHRLREQGHEVAVDDFGTGYSSLSYLSTFELDVLKIDKSFVDAIGTGAATSHVIVHVIEMAQSLGLRTVAEGVETEEQARWLIEHGVDYAQGYLYSPAINAEAFGEFVRVRAAA
ncbi:MAG: EAL domain-containing protein [Gemmatimonadaceae bacterium]